LSAASVSPIGVTELRRDLDPDRMIELDEVRRIGGIDRQLAEVRLAMAVDVERCHELGVEVA
jgi:hypothetical protein